MRQASQIGGCQRRASLLLTDDVAQRLAALEATVAELRAYLPMLARLAYYEDWTDRSVPEHLDEVGEVFAALGSMLFQHSSRRHDRVPNPDTVEIEDPPAVLRRVEPLPPSADYLRKVNED